jgi:anhydro-N-acetylmuramic acid kinase
MSGTSMDGIDVALIDTDGQKVNRFGPTATFPYDRPIADALRKVVANPLVAEKDPLKTLDQAVTHAHAKAVQRFLADNQTQPGLITLIGFHGQTVLHRPERHFTRQLGDGKLLAETVGIDVVNDFRRADMEAGGQGAPLAPLYHQALATDLPQPLAVLNLGGVGNVTYVDGSVVMAFDTGPGNALMDDWALKHTGKAWDENGKLAASGKADDKTLLQLLAHPYFRKRPPKSLDRNDFKFDAAAGLTPADGMATLAAFTAKAVARARDHLPKRVRRWIVTGGGRRNPILMKLLAETLGAAVDPAEAVSWNGDALEAQAFAFLAVRSIQGQPLSLPSTTGVPFPTTGGVLHKAPKPPA